MTSSHPRLRLTHHSFGVLCTTYVDFYYFWVDISHYI